MGKVVCIGNRKKALQLAKELEFLRLVTFSASFMVTLFYIFSVFRFFEFIFWL